MKKTFLNIFGLLLKRIFKAFRFFITTLSRHTFSVMKLLFIIKPLIFLKTTNFLIRPLLKIVLGTGILASFMDIDIVNKFLGVFDFKSAASFLKGLAIVQSIKNLTIFEYFKKANIKVVETIHSTFSNDAITDDIKNKASQKLAKENDDIIITRKDYKNAVSDVDNYDDILHRYMAIIMIALIGGLIFFFFGSDIFDFFKRNWSDDSAGGNNDNNNDSITITNNTNNNNNITNEELFASDESDENSNNDNDNNSNDHVNANITDEQTAREQFLDRLRIQVEAEYKERAEDRKAASLDAKILLNPREIPRYVINYFDEFFANKSPNKDMFATAMELLEKEKENALAEASTSTLPEASTSTLPESSTISQEELNLVNEVNGNGKGFSPKVTEAELSGGETETPRNQSKTVRSKGKSRE